MLVTGYYMIISHSLYNNMLDMHQRASFSSANTFRHTE